MSVSIPGRRLSKAESTLPPFAEEHEYPQEAYKQEHSPVGDHNKWGQFRAASLHSSKQAVDRALRKYVIQKSEETASGWTFRSLFIVEATTFNITLLSVALFLWIVNRQTHIRPTKGSKIKHIQRETDDDDISDSDDQNANLNGEPQTIKRTSTTVQRQSIQSQILQYDIEVDEEEEADLTLNQGVSDIPLTTEKRALLKVIKTVKIFSYLSEEAMALCLESVQFVNATKGENIFAKGKYDGSLYAVISGRVRCRFHEHCVPNSEPPDLDDEAAYQRVMGVTYSNGEVITSLLAMLTGMSTEVSSNHAHKLATVMPFVKSIEALSLENSQLIRIPPHCFAQVLERHPADVFRIAQTVLSRAQRITLQALVETLGLRQELLVAPIPPKVGIHNPLAMPWLVHLQSMLSNLTSTKEEQLKAQAALMTARLLGINDTKDSDSIKIILEYSSIVSISRDSCLIATGEIHNYFYLVMNGSVESGVVVPKTKEFQRFETVTAGQLVGEYVCFTGDISLFDVRCSAETCTLFKIPRHIYKHLIHRFPRSMAISLVEILQRVSSEVHLLSWTSEYLYVEAAEEIVKRGDPCDSMFIVLNGRVRATLSSRQMKEGLLTINRDLEYGRGKIVGEVGCLTGSKWNFNLYAIRNTEVVKVKMRTLLAIIGVFPSAGLSFARAIADKVASAIPISDTPDFHGSSETPDTQGRALSAISLPSNQLPTTAMPSYGLRLATIAVVPLTDSVNLDQFCHALLGGLGQIAPCKLLTKQIVRAELGEQSYRNRNAMRDLRLTRLLADMEENHRLIVYQADQTYTWWTRLCVQQADCILLVVNAQRAPGRRRVEQCLEWAHQSMNVRIDLVVVGSSEQEDEFGNDDEIDYEADEEMTVSDQLNNWSERRKWVSGHHLVRKPFRRFPLDFRRLCRRISGHAVGLVLGGGGARGLAHLGVIRALLEAGVTVDLVGGTSQGAFVGALFSRQPDDYDEVFEACKKMAQDMSSVRNKLFDLTLPMTSMFCGRLFNRGIRKLLGNVRIQDLVLNFFCISVDLQKQKQIVHTKGILWKYVRASMSLTGYLPPVAENGSLLVDGGYLNVVPADVMRKEMGARLVIAVDVSPESEREYFNYGMTLSGWWLLWNSWNPFSKTVQVPSMGDISDMLIWVSSNNHRRDVKRVSDLYLAPPVQNIGTLEYNRFDETVQIGYEYSKPMVKELVKKHPWLVSKSSVSLKIGSSN